MIEKLKLLLDNCLARAWMCHLLKQLRIHQQHFAAGLTCSQLWSELRSRVDMKRGATARQTNPIMSTYIRFKTWIFNFLMKWWVNSMAPRLSRRVELVILQDRTEEILQVESRQTLSADVCPEDR